MAKLVIGPFNRGQKTNREPFNIDNDSFPVLQNAYQWRGRIKRKRGTEFLTRLTRYFNSALSAYNSGSSTIVLDGSGVGNILTGWSLEANANVAIGNVTITDTISLIVYTDPNMDGTLSPNGTINYSSGKITILAAAGHAITATFTYYPNLPVMGLEDFILPSNPYPGTIGFDTVYSYIISNSLPSFSYAVNFYKNLPTGAYTGYIQKTSTTSLTWNGQDYQQFWTVNYQGAMFATNGINVPFSITNVGMQYRFIENITNIVVGPPASAQLTITNHGLSRGDFVFINEVTGMTTGSPVFSTINFQTGYVTSVVNANNVIVTFPNATFNGVAYISGGIAQYLTNRVDPTLDGIRWFDGDPTNGSPTNPVLVRGLGWVNYNPPLSNLSYSIAGLPLGQYYLVTARMIVAFKDRLIFIGPVVQTSSAGSQVYLQDTVIYSQNGTPYYTASFTGDPALATTIFTPILVPANQSATASAMWEDSPGFGGFITAGIDQPINSVGPNEDVLIMGFSGIQARFVYTGNDILPFNFFLVNSDLGSSSVFSSVVMDKGVFTRGARGFVISNQSGSERVDLEIPDEVFEIALNNNGAERITAQRDYISEWIYYTYPNNKFVSRFPTQTLQYNYRDDSWGTFFESYTTYGIFRPTNTYTWATIGLRYPTWSVWNDPWNAGLSTVLQQQVIAGNQQGFVMIRDDGTTEENSLYINSFAGQVVTSPDHCLNTGDYIVINNALGSIGAEVNGNVFQVLVQDDNTFAVSPTYTSGLSYFGGGTITRMYVPLIQTKQFPVAWEIGRKTRIGVQQYLLTTTSISQVTLLIFLSQNAADAYNIGNIVPQNNVVNSSLIYSTVLYTCPESTNLGLTPANVNLNMITATEQEQIWHRISTSLIGDTVQLGLTLSDSQMRDPTLTFQFAEIELHAINLEVYPSMVLA